MRRILCQALLIVVLGSAIGLVVNWFSPRRIPWLRPPKMKLAANDLISLEQATVLWKSGEAIFLDARPPTAYADGHIVGALSLPIESFDVFFPKVQPRLATDMMLVLYCDGEHCDDSHRLLLKLRALGYANTRVLVNGWTRWRSAKLPTVTGEQP